MADEYPWGKEAPAKRVTKLETNLRNLDKRRDDLVTAHKAKIAELDEAERALKADLKAASSILEKERKDTQVASALKVLERVLGGSSLNIEDALKSGQFEQDLAGLVEKIEAAASAPAGEPDPKQSTKKPSGRSAAENEPPKSIGDEAGTEQNSAESVG